MNRKENKAMRELTISGPISVFDLPVNPNEAACVTTNGMCRKDGSAVMGAGIARLANSKYKIAPQLGKLLKKYGNHVHCLGHEFKNEKGLFTIFSFPTKNAWFQDSDLPLIVRSATELVTQCDRLGITRCYITRPGCLNGRLAWTDVRDAISKVLDDRFVIVSHASFDLK